MALPPPKPMNGAEMVARMLVLEGLVLAIAKESKLPPNLRDDIRKAVLSFNRPELTAITDAYIEEIAHVLNAPGAVND